MPVQYVTEADFDSLVPAEVRRKLYADESGNYQATLFNTAAEHASAYIQSKALNAGYEIPSPDTGQSTTDGIVRLATLAVLVRLAYSRMQQEVPEVLEELLSEIPEELQVGDTPLTEIEPSPFTGVGGNRFSSSAAAGSRRPVMRDIGELL